MRGVALFGAPTPMSTPPMSKPGLLPSLHCGRKPYRSTQPWSKLTKLCFLSQRSGTCSCHTIAPGDQNLSLARRAPYWTLSSMPTRGSKGTFMKDLPVEDGLYLIWSNSSLTATREPSSLRPQSSIQASFRFFVYPEVGREDAVRHVEAMVSHPVVQGL